MLLRVIQSRADAAGRVDWSVSVDSSIVRAHQHSARPCSGRQGPARAIRAHLRARGIGSVIPEPDDQKAHRKRRGSRGGRPVSHVRNAYRGRNVSERALNGFKHWRGLATTYDKHAIVYRGGLVLAAAVLWLAD
jgi:hypothetical protein